MAVTTAPIESVAAVRRRPKDRKAQIARASAESFSLLGYHAVSMEVIAAQVGISAPALYRHYASKYDLFRGAVLTLGQQLVDCTDFADAESGDAAATLDQLRVVNRRIQQPLMVIRPALTSSHRWMLSSGLLSLIGSIVDHRVALTDD